MRPFVALGIATLITLVAPNAHAGQSNSDFAACNANGDGSGYCYGTFAGFRNASDSSALAEFISGSHYSNEFAAYLNSQWYVCSFPQNSAFDQQLIYAFASPTEEFSISWDKGGNCTSLYVYRGSEFGQ